MSKKNIFISYARRDGRELALKLQNSLIEMDYDVWLDTSEIDGGASWGSDIEQAIDDCHILLALLSRASYESEICRAEQLRALRKKKRVIPLLVQANAEPPIWMESLNYRDFSLMSDFDKNIIQLNQDMQSSEYNAPEIPPTFTNAPPLPNSFVDRPEEMQALRQMILSDATDRRLALTALRGMGGIGKSILAGAICHDSAIQDAFPDGVFWLEIGREVINLLDKLKIIGTTLGDPAEHYSSTEAATARLRLILPEKSVLIVLDDVWKQSDVQPFLVQAPQSRWLITTRDGRISNNLGASELQLGKLTDEQSAELLREWAKRSDPHEADLVDVLDGHPLAVKLVGSKLAGGMTGEDWLNSYDSVARIKDKRRPKLKDDSIELCFDISLDSIESDDRPLYHALGIFPEDIWIPEATVKQLWQALDSELDTGDCADVLMDLENLSLIERESNLTAIRMHDLLHSYNRHRLGDDYGATQQDLIKQWGDLTELPDSYAWQNIAYHLDSAGMLAELKALLLNIDFLQAKLEQTNPNALIADYDSFKDETGKFTDESMHLVQSAVSMSSHVLVKDTTQLVSQLYARLMGYREKYREIDSLLIVLDNKLHTKSTPGLRPIYQTMQMAGGALIRTLEGHSKPVKNVALSGDYALSTSLDKTVIVWNWQTGEQVRVLHGHLDRVNSVALSGDYAISASHDKTIIIWNWQTGEQIRVLHGHSDHVWSVALSGDYALSASEDKTVIVWNWQTGEQIRVLHGHSNHVWSVALSGDYALSTSEDKTIIVWNWQTGERVRTLQGHSDWVLSVAIAGEYALSASADKTIIVWNWQTGEQVRVLHGHSHNVLSVALSGDYALSASNDKTIIVWNWQTGELVRVLHGHANYVWGVVLSGDYAISVSVDRSVKVWNWQTGEQVRTRQGHSNFVFCVALSGNYALTAAADRTVIVWNWQTGEQVRTLLGHSDFVQSVALSGDYALSASHDQTIIVWNWQTGEQVRVLEGHSDIVWSVALSGDYALSTSSDKTIIVWNWQTGELVRTLQGHSDIVWSVALSGDYALSTSSDKTIIVWNWQTGEQVRVLHGHSDAVHFVALSGEYALSTSKDKTIIVWNWQTGELVRTLQGHSSAVYGLVISGEYVLSASHDRTIIVWNWQTGERITTFTTDSRQNTVAIADGVIISGGEDSQVHFFKPNNALRKLLGW